MRQPSQSADKEPQVMGDSNSVDPTPGWIPLVVVIGLAVPFLILMVIAAIFIR